MRFLKILIETWHKFQKDQGFILSAALAFYSIFSIIPIFVLSLIITGIFVNNALISSFIIESVNNFIGEEIGEAFRIILKNSLDYQRQGSIIGLIFLIFGATFLVSHIQETINQIWEIRERRLISKRKKLKRISVRRIRSLGLVLGGILIFFVFTTLSILINLLSFYFYGLISYLNYIVWFIFMTLFFCFLFKFVPLKHYAIKQVFPGAVFTSVFFIIGQIVLSEYFKIRNIESIFGALGTLIILILWIYYSSIVFYFGAEFTYLRIKKLQSINLKK